MPAAIVPTLQRDYVRPYGGQVLQTSLSEADECDLAAELGQSSGSASS